MAFGDASSHLCLSKAEMEGAAARSPRMLLQALVAATLRNYSFSEPHA